ncbi:MAG: flagellar biosynthesis repressor FlbT [Alphaproteobacteria bacterium]|nr:flagellar biosynthesis repressor FlbT [Alphaproteobacteria bacterium]MBF0249290.1 flagellar biosynthesis repressor FlbT [Alphaproteobacteria bacterium]
MPLLIDFKAGDKLLINGSALENIGHNTKLLVHNKSAVLREKEVLSQEDAQTPASRVYFELQSAYILPEQTQRDEALKRFQQRLGEFIAACPKAKPIADKVTSNIDADRIYKGLKEAQNLIRYEADVLETFSQQLKQFLAENDLDVDMVEVEATE